MAQRDFPDGTKVRLKKAVADGDTRTAVIKLHYIDIDGGVRLDRELNGHVSWNVADLKAA
jgi:hypothetical protein